ncbi:RNA polymerase-associated protein rtf1 [Vermiconidia calcicola]|uniref:RNA polymerase-associated protein rtf1 n=1 Tax=Vermiconidia calcicola TaxID=1690605 RepID=A0ACC3ME43_9PEZI|nr:RNA polymerase-associated protein rtf1 [Vermiconidia calcicola]
MSADELDVDAELLAMAGDDDDSSDAGSDAGEVVEDTQQHVEDRTPSEEPKPSVEKAEEPAGTRRGVAQKVKKRGGRKKVSKREIEDELDDLNDSPSPAASLGSDAMSESPEASAANAPPSPPEDVPLYPLEGQFLSADDREHILGLPEIQRESILAERAQENLKRTQDLQLKKALAATQAAASKHKRKAAAADLEEDGPRKSSRPAKTIALDHYKKAREAKGAERTSRFDTGPGRRRPSRSRTPASDRDAEGESEVEWADTTTTSRREEPPAELKDFERCRVGRSYFAKVVFYPNFEETMKGCFARVSIGFNRQSGQNEYRMTQIKAFTHGKPYSLEVGPNGKTIMCDLYANVAHGTHEKPWPFSACSDSRFTDSEFQRYAETMSKERLRAPKKAWLVQKVEDINKFLNPTWDEATLGNKFRKQKEMQQRVDPANAAKVKKEAIMKRRTEAETAGDEEEVSRCDAELAALENNAATANGSTPLKTMINKTANSPNKPPAAISSQDKLAELNRKNRKQNAEDVRKAQRAEREKYKLERAKAKKAAAALAVPGSGDMRELFGDLSDMSRAGTPMSGVGTPKLRGSRAGTPMGVKEKSKLGFGGKKQQSVDDELGGLDLGIDVEI